MLDRGLVPFQRALGPAIGRMLAHRYRAHGIDVHVASGATGFRTGPDGRLSGVALTDGRELECDVALVAIGVEQTRELCRWKPEPPVDACGDVAGSLGHWTRTASEAIGNDPARGSALAGVMGGASRFSTRSKARPMAGSRPTSTASKARLSSVRTTMPSSLSTTWMAVRTSLGPTTVPGPGREPPPPTRTVERPARSTSAANSCDTRDSVEDSACAEEVRQT